MGTMYSQEGSTLMRKLPRKRKTADIFAKRIIITIPRNGVIVLALALALSVTRASLGYWLNVVSLAITLAALTVVLVARRQVRELRYEMHSALNNIENDPNPEPEPERVSFKRINDANNTRISG
jgi:hypothetical protein